MKKLYLLKLGELCLKKGNQNYFTRVLKNNIKLRLRPYKSILTVRNGRFYLETEAPESLSKQILDTTFGITGYSEAFISSKKKEILLDDIESLVRRIKDDLPGETFKIEVRRIDKSLPYNSYELACDAGERILTQFPEFTVNVKKPDWTINIELREKTYLYSHTTPGKGGLPVSTSGKAVLLLSGGIDSPTAGYLMNKRGLKTTAIFFHTPPYTSADSVEKVKTLASKLAPWNNGMELYAVPFTPVQMKINKEADPAETTLHSRAAMMTAASLLAERIDAEALITGEALGQVASQTIRSLRFTDNITTLPVFRPLIGMDKLGIIDISRKIDTYETSILPYDDCCALFSPEHPVTQPDFDHITTAWNKLKGIKTLIEEALDNAEVFEFSSEENFPD